MHPEHHEIKSLLDKWPTKKNQWFTQKNKTNWRKKHKNLVIKKYVHF